MAECNFTITFSGEATAIVSRIQSQIQQQGGNFNGDDNAGSFGLKVMGSTISGDYTVAGSQITVNINDKPFFLSCDMIESFLKNQIGG